MVKTRKTGTPDGKPAASTAEQGDIDDTTGQGGNSRSTTPTRTATATPTVQVGNNGQKLCQHWKHAINTFMRYKKGSDNEKDIIEWLKYQGLFTRMDDINFLTMEDFKLDSPMLVKNKQTQPGNLVSTFEYLNSAQYSLIKAVIQFARYQDDQKPGILFNFDEWQNFTQQDFRQYHAKHTATPPGVNYNSDHGKSMDLVELHNFSKTIKRDSSAFPKLQNDKYFDPFCRSFVIMAEQQSCAEILNPDYTPSSDPASKALFQKKNTYMYSVMHQSLLTDKGKYLTRKYATTSDAQQVWKEFIHHIKRSSKGEQAKSEIHEYITSASIDSSYKGKTESFILGFVQYFRRLDEMTSDDERMSYPFRINMFKKAVKSIPELEIVSTLDEYNRVMYNATSTPEDAYDTYTIFLPMLLSDMTIKFLKRKQEGFKSMSNLQILPAMTTLLHPTN